MFDAFAISVRLHCEDDFAGILMSAESIAGDGDADGPASPDQVQGEALNFPA
jgi:hypothetical protein